MNRKKFTLIDGLIVAAVLVCGAVVAKVLTPSVPETNGSVEFVILATEQEAEVADSIKVGDEVILSYTQKDTEEITAVDVKPADLITFDSVNGEYKAEKSKTTKDVFVTVKADAEITDESIKVDEMAIRIGQHVPISSRNYAMSGYIVEIKSVTENGQEG